MFDSKEIARLALLRAEEIKTEKKRNRNRWGSAGILCGIGAAAAVMLTLFPLNSRSDYSLLIDDPLPLAAPQIPDVISMPFTEVEPWDNPGFIIPHYDSVTIAAGSPEVNMLLSNPAENFCLLTFEIILQETEETLYNSGMIAPDMYIEDLALSRPLEEGVYNAVLKIQACDLENLTILSESNVYFTLIAE